MDEAATKEELRPVKKQLVSVIVVGAGALSDHCVQKNLKLSGGDMPRDEKVAILKESLAAIGKRIEAVLQEKAQKGEDTKRWKRHLWTFVTLFWPKKVKAAKLEELHTKMVTKEKESSSAPRAGSSEVSSVAKKPRLSSTAPSRPNGSSSSSHVNGKYR